MDATGAQVQVEEGSAIEEVAGYFVEWVVLELQGYQAWTVPGIRGFLSDVGIFDELMHLGDIEDLIG